MKDKLIYVKFNETWKESCFDFDENILNVLNSKNEFYYNDETTIRDLLKELAEKFENYFGKFDNPNIKVKYDDFSLKGYFSVIYNGMPTYIYNLHSKLNSLINIVDVKNNILTFEPNIVLFGGCGDIWLIEGIRYYMNSKENTSHNILHIHVSYKNKEVSISILDGQVLAGGIKNTVQKEVIKRIVSNKKELALAWNTKTDGKNIDIDEIDFSLGG